MNRIARYGLLAGASVLLLAGSNQLMAHGGGGGGGGRGNRGNMDPAAMQAAMLERMKETLGVTDDADWKVISEKLGKVMTLRREATMGGFGGMGGARRGGAAGGATDTAGPARPANPVRDALQKAIDSGDTAAIKTALVAFYADRTAKQAALKAAQEDLKRLLTAKQEGILALQGY